MGQKVRRRPYAILGTPLTPTQPINERIKDLDFKDTKVRVTNVDSQGSDANIVIQVIGEISNHGQPHKRFVQTFVLAEQTNGYFVLNDIFRYLAEEPEEEEEQLETAANGVEESAPTAVAAEDESEKLASSEEDLTKVDQKLEEVAQQEPAVEAAAEAPAEQAPEAEETPEVEETPAPAAEAPKEPEAPVEEAIEAEKPKDPAPTPAPAAAKAAPVAMPKPSVPRTWASLAASAHKVVTPVVPAPAGQQAPSQAKSATSSQPAAAAPAQAPAAARDQSPAASQGEAAGWQTATGHKKEQSRVQNPAPAADADQKRAYIKNVYSQVEEGPLRAALSKFGEIEYLDISRGKVCEHFNLHCIKNHLTLMPELRLR
jgi:hypothetical protein